MPERRDVPPRGDARAQRSTTAARAAEPRVLVIDADASLSGAIALALERVGFVAGRCAMEATALASAVAQLRPALLLARAELPSAELATLLTRLEEAQASALPLALLCRDAADDVYLRTMRRGVVALLAEPFNPATHGGRLRMLLAELPERSGTLRGRGGPQELSALLQHIVRARRTGRLSVGDPEEGRASFVNGAIQRAAFQGQAMQAAVARLASTELPWTFVESAAEDAALEAPLLEAVALHDAERTTSSEDVPVIVARPLPARRTTLLFVDDDPTVSQLLSSFFTKQRYTVVVAAEGLEALARLATVGFDLVIADLNMPRLDGWGLLRAIREDFSIHETPVALFSSADDARESLRLLHAGADAYFPKTMRLTALEVHVRELLEPRRRFARLIGSDGGLTFDFAALGSQWVCRALAEAGFSGQLDAADAWGSWRLWFDAGRLLHASARMGTTSIAGDHALGAFLTSRGASGSLLPGTPALDDAFGGRSTADTLQRVVPQLREEHRRAREDQLAQASALHVHEALYQLYTTVGPPVWLPIARLLCEAKLTPAEVIARLQVTPPEVAAVVRDLLRRGVATLH